MKKLKRTKLQLQHLIALGSALGMVGAFIWSLFDKKKTGSIILFVVSLLGLLSGIGMELGLIPVPEKCKKLEVELEDEDEDEELSLDDPDFCDTTVVEIDE
ncbi:MAG: hypothetical protein IJY89_00715 [Clostridia bacterium]|nr:hypothetical protein [Clostridia bacterium]